MKKYSLALFLTFSLCVAPRAFAGWPIGGGGSGGGGGGSGDITDVWGCATGDCSAITGASGDTFNATSANSSIPQPLSTTLPATCTEGMQYQDTDAGGSETYKCTATNTWTKLIAATDNVATTTALAANGANCLAGEAPRGVDASGAVENCTAYQTLFTDSASLRSALSDENGTGAALFSGAISPAFTTPAITTSATVTRDAIGSTSADGLVFANTTPAANNAQQWSPRARFTGQGYGTTAPGSQSVDWIVENVPVQGTTAPTSELRFSYAVNGGAYVNEFAVKSTGELYFDKGFGAGAPYMRPVSGAIQIGQGSASPFTSIKPGSVIHANGGSFGWTASSTDPNTTVETTIKRFGAGIVEFNNGTSIGTTVGNARHILAARHKVALITTLPLAAELSIAGSNVQDMMELDFINGKACLVFNITGTVTYLCAPLNGTPGTVAWTNGTSAP